MPKRTPGTARPSGAASPPATSDSELRRAVADRSVGVVVWLSRLPTYLVPALMVLLLLVGLLAPLAIAVVSLVVIIGFIGWLAFLSWPVLVGPQRGMRLLALGILVLALVGRLGGWL